MKASPTLALILVVLLAVMACSPAAPPAATTAPAAAPAVAKKGGMLMFGKAQEAAGLDPHLTTSLSSRMLTALVYERLVYLNDKGEPTPELAEKWTNPDPTTYTFTLRKGVKFHNGRELKAADVKYSFGRILDPATASPWAAQVSIIQSVEAVDDSTVTFKLQKPFGPFLRMLAFDWASIVPQEVVAQYGDVQQHMIGTGPFSLEEYTQDTRTVLKAFPGYWGTAPLVDGITFRIITDEAARLASLRTGEVQMAMLSDPLAVGMASRTDGLKVISQPTTDYYQVAFNVRQKPFDDVRVRQAMALAVDRKSIMDTVVFGDAELDGVLPPSLGDWALPPAQLPYFKRDVPRAKALLAEAGYASGFTFTVLASPYSSQYPAIGLAMQSQLKEIGVTVDVDRIEWGSFLAKWRARDFASFITVQAAGSDPDHAMYQYYLGGSSFNAVGLDDPQLSTLLETGRSETDPAKRKAIYNDAQMRLDELVPNIYLFTRTEYMGIRANVQGFTLSPLNTFTYRALRTVSVS